MQSPPTSDPIRAAYLAAMRVGADPHAVAVALAACLVDAYAAIGLSPAAMVEAFRDALVMARSPSSEAH